MPQNITFLTNFLKAKTIAEAHHINAEVRDPHVSHSEGFVLTFTDGSSLSVSSDGSGSEDCHGLILVYRDFRGEIEEYWEEP